jgi:hypothetical protein
MRASVLIFQLGSFVPIIMLDYFILASDITVANNLRVTLRSKVGNFFGRMDRVRNPRSCKQVNIGVITRCTYREEVNNDHNDTAWF